MEEGEALYRLMIVDDEHLSRYACKLFYRKIQQY